jgi:hypothetical protein
MKLLFLLPTLALALAATALSAQADARVFEMRTYYAAPGKLDALHARFRDHTTKLFEKHGITNLGYWVPIENHDNKLIYVLAYPSREAREISWKAFGDDPDWIAARNASEVDGKLVTKVEQLFLTATDYSPEIKPSTGAGERVFELRTYTTPPGKLPALHARFREHTMALFQKHGMTNLFYWQLMPDQPKNANLLGTPDTTLVYLLAHASLDTAKASFGAFRADPEWIAAKEASERANGGYLTIPDPNGYVSLFMNATDYSPTR